MPPLTHKALRPIAVFEALKGVGALVAGIVAVGFLDRDNEAFAEDIIRHLHIDPTWHYARIFIETMGQASDSLLMSVAGFLAFYATIRFVEAYGLWRERRWAEWLAALSGGVYLPIEIFEIVHRPSWIKFAALTLNVIVVAYMVWLLSLNKRRQAAAPKNG